MKIFSNKELDAIHEQLAYIGIVANAAIETEVMAKRGAFGLYKPSFPKDSFDKIKTTVVQLEGILK